MRDLYPALLAWCARTQASGLTQPAIAHCALQDTTLTSSRQAHYRVLFSEPMRPDKAVDILLTAAKEPRQQRVVTLTKAANALRWSTHGQQLDFDLALENNCKNRVAFNMPWNTERALTSKKGVHAKVYQSSITTQVAVP